MNNFQLSENFNLREFQCKCGCETVKVSSELVAKLQQLRDTVGKPLVITSGYRCPEHNKKVGGVSDSYHTKGMAADVACPTGYTVEEFAKLCQDIGFTGVGAYPDKFFVHVDVRPGNPVRFQ